MILLVANHNIGFFLLGFLESMVTPASIYNQKLTRSSIPSYDSVIVIGENNGLASYNEAVGLSRDTVSLHM